MVLRLCRVADVEDMCCNIIRRDCMICIAAALRRLINVYITLQKLFSLDGWEHVGKWMRLPGQVWQRAE